MYENIKEAAKQYDVEYFNEEFESIRTQLENLKEKAQNQGYNDLVYGINKILETWDNAAIVA